MSDTMKKMEEIITDRLVNEAIKLNLQNPNELTAWEKVNDRIKKEVYERWATHQIGFDR